MVDSATLTRHRTPPGPDAQYNTADDLFLWMNENFIKYGDIYRASVFGANDVYVVSNPEYCERILRNNWRNYSRSGLMVARISLLLGNGLVSSNGEFWANQRRMIQPVFSKSAIAGFTGIMARVNAELLEKWRLAAIQGRAVNVTRDVSAMVLKITLTAIFGDDYPAAAQHFSILSDETARSLEFAQLFRKRSKIILEIAAQRRRNCIATDDILGRMMMARDRDHGELMPDRQLAMEVMTLVVGGHETTASLLNWLWYLLSQHPEAQDKLSEEFDQMPWDGAPNLDMIPKYTYTRCVIDEALRLYPPVWLMTRRALHDDQLGEFFVPAGTEIYISPYLIQRSPHLWEMPERFDPDRTQSKAIAGRHVLAMCPFGAGPRNCIGELFARVETQIHLMMFARELRLIYGDANAPEIKAGVHLLSKHDLVMMPEVKRGTLRTGLPR
jgi:cytochrome P450